MNKTIVSVCDWELHADRPFSESAKQIGRTDFVLPPAAANSYSSLLVKDMFFRERDGSRGTHTNMETAENIAADLVNEWGSVGSPGGAGPGVAVIAGDTPTPKEIAALRAKLAAWYQENRAAASEAWASNKRKLVMVNPVYKRASKYLGFDKDPWMLEMDEATLKAVTKCPSCRMDVPDDAITCSHCGAVVNIEAWAAYEAKKAAALAAASSPPKPIGPPPPPPQPANVAKPIR